MNIITIAELQNAVKKIKIVKASEIYKSESKIKDRIQKIRDKKVKKQNLEFAENQENGPKITVQIKPLSVNQAWQGRRFKTQKYLNYELQVLHQLPLFKIDNTKMLSVSIIFNLSNRGNDIDNGIKPFLDILQKKYEFNDSQIYELKIKKLIVKKGNESIVFWINYLD